MDKLNRCFRIHLDLSSIQNVDVFLSRLIEIGDLTIVDNSILIWIGDGKEKKDLLKSLKKSGVNEFFCEAIEYNDINKNEDNYNYSTSWFIENYRKYSERWIEKEEQEILKQMYNNIEKAKEELARKQELSKNSDDKNINQEGAIDG